MTPTHPIKPVLRSLEDRWILAAVDQVLFGKPAGEDRPPAAGVDWKHLRSQASMHALVPCLADYCQGRTGDVPSEFLAQIQTEKTQITLYNFCLLQELTAICSHCSDAQIRVLPWKGPAIAAAVYPALGLRVCKDLDLLVWPGQMEQALAVLRGRGYVEGEWEEGRHTRNLTRQSPKIFVELHGQFAQDYFSMPISSGSLWKNAGELQTSAGPIPAPAPEIAVLMLCAHGAKHTWQRLNWICDVALLLRTCPDFRWEKLAAEARDARLVRVLRSGLLLVHGIDPSVVPKPVLEEALADSASVRLAEKCAGWLLLPKFGYRIEIDKYWFLVAMHENVRDRLPALRFLLQRALTPRDEDRAVLKLPVWLAFGYYLIRPVRLLLKLIRPAIPR